VVDGNELAWVRLELDILASSRTIAPLSAGDEARYKALTRRELELLGVEPDTHSGAGT
jgi:hypothetical protein